MIQLQELRKGNILEVDGQYIKVSHFDNDAIYEEDEFNDVGAFDIQECEPVLLTDEIFKKCRFEKKVLPPNYSGGKNGHEILIRRSASRYLLIVQNICLIYDSGDVFSAQCLADCYMLHQLQNLYFAIIGEELKIQL